MIGQEILFALWFFLPAGLANAAPVFANKIPYINKHNQPLDFGKSFRGKRIFGDHKTFRGLIAGIVMAVIVLVLQKYLYTESSWIQTISQPVDYRHIHTLGLGMLFAIGALGFDAIKSFFKRQIGVQPGSTWFPFDQIDYIIGGLLLSSLVVTLPLSAYFWIVFAWFLLHLIGTFAGWLIGLRESPI